MDISTNPELVSVNTSPAVCPVIDVPGPSLLVTVRDNPPRTGRLRRKVMRGKPRHGAVTYSGYSLEMETMDEGPRKFHNPGIGPYWSFLLVESAYQQFHIEESIELRHYAK